MRVDSVFPAFLNISVLNMCPCEPHLEMLFGQALHGKCRPAFLSCVPLLTGLLQSPQAALLSL